MNSMLSKMLKSSSAIALVLLSSCSAFAMKENIEPSVKSVVHKKKKGIASKAIKTWKLLPVVIENKFRDNHSAKSVIEKKIGDITVISDNSAPWSYQGESEAFDVEDNATYRFSYKIKMKKEDKEKAGLDLGVLSGDRKKYLMNGLLQKGIYDAITEEYSGQIEFSSLKELKDQKKCSFIFYNSKKSDEKPPFTIKEMKFEKEEIQKTPIVEMNNEWRDKYSAKSVLERKNDIIVTSDNLASWSYQAESDAFDVEGNAKYKLNYIVKMKREDRDKADLNLGVLGGDRQGYLMSNLLQKGIYDAVKEEYTGQVELSDFKGQKQFSLIFYNGRKSDEKPQFTIKELKLEKEGTQKISIVDLNNKWRDKHSAKSVIEKKTGDITVTSDNLTPWSYQVESDGFDVEDNATYKLNYIVQMKKGDKEKIGFDLGVLSGDRKEYLMSNLLQRGQYNAKEEEYTGQVEFSTLKELKDQKQFSLIFYNNKKSQENPPFTIKELKLEKESAVKQELPLVIEKPVKALKRPLPPLPEGIKKSTGISKINKKVLKIEKKPLEIRERGREEFAPPPPPPPPPQDPLFTIEEKEPENNEINIHDTRGSHNDDLEKELNRRRALFYDNDDDFNNDDDDSFGSGSVDTSSTTIEESSPQQEIEKLRNRNIDIDKEILKIQISIDDIGEIKGFSPLLKTKQTLKRQLGQDIKNLTQEKKRNRLTIVRLEDELKNPKKEIKLESVLGAEKGPIITESTRVINKIKESELHGVMISSQLLENNKSLEELEKEGKDKVGLAKTFHDKSVENTKKKIEELKIKQIENNRNLEKLKKELDELRQKEGKEDNEDL